MSDIDNNTYMDNDNKNEDGGDDNEYDNNYFISHLGNNHVNALVITTLTLAAIIYIMIIIHPIISEVNTINIIISNLNLEPEIL